VGFIPIYNQSGYHELISKGVEIDKKKVAYPLGEFKTETGDVKSRPGI